MGLENSKAYSEKTRERCRNDDMRSQLEQWQEENGNEIHKGHRERPSQYGKDGIHLHPRQRTGLPRKISHHSSKPREGISLEEISN